MSIRHPGLEALFSGLVSEVRWDDLAALVTAHAEENVILDFKEAAQGGAGGSPRGRPSQQKGTRHGRMLWPPASLVPSWSAQAGHRRSQRPPTERREK